MMACPGIHLDMARRGVLVCARRAATRPPVKSRTSNPVARDRASQPHRERYVKSPRLDRLTGCCRESKRLLPRSRRGLFACTPMETQDFVAVVLMSARAHPGCAPITDLAAAAIVLSDDRPRALRVLAAVEASPTDLPAILAGDVPTLVTAARQAAQQAQREEARHG